MSGILREPLLKFCLCGPLQGEQAALCRQGRDMADKLENSNNWRH
jgi:hypothetical protein